MICVVYVKSSELDPTFLLHGLACVAGVGNRQHIGHISSFDTDELWQRRIKRETYVQRMQIQYQLDSSVYTPAPYGPFDSDISSVHLDLYHRELKLCVFVILVQVERFFDDSRHLPQTRSRQTLGSQKPRSMAGQDRIGQNGRVRYESRGIFLFG